MKKKIMRQTVIGFLSTYDCLMIENKEQMFNRLLDVGGDIDELNTDGENVFSPTNNELVIDLNKFLLEGVTNFFLGYRLNYLLNCNIEVIGEATLLEVCPCCKYRTLTEKGEYCICKLCYWEDVGNIDENEYCGPNRMTLLEAKRKWEYDLETGNISKILLSKYYKEV